MPPMIYYATFDNDKRYFTIRYGQYGWTRPTEDHVIADCIRSAIHAERMVEWMNGGTLKWCHGFDAPTVSTAH